MPIKFRQPQDINAIRFGAALVWGAVNGIITTIQGTSPLSLVNAVAGRIKSLVQYGKCTTVDDEIYCNNGKLIIVDDELPAEYQRQIGFKFAASTYYRILDFHLRGTDTVRISFSVDKACNVFGCYTNTTAEDNYSLYASTSSGGKYLRYDGSTYNSYIPSAQVEERIDAIITPTGTSGMPTDSIITPVEFEAAADLCIGTTSTSASSSKLDGNIWGNFVVDGRLTLIPCKRLSDDALGYYDLDSDTFYEPIGPAPTSLGVDTSHLTVLSVVGTPEVLTVTGKNLMNVATNTKGYYIRASGEIIVDGSPKSQYTDLIPVRAGEKYTWSLKSYRSVAANNRWHGYDSSGEWVQQISAKEAGTDGAAFTLTSTIPDGISYVRLSYGLNDTDAQFERGDVTTAYEAPSIQTASVVNLFSTGTVHDEQDVISGTITRKTVVSISGGVITISALATPITEYVTSQPMRTAEGDNTVSVTSTVDPVQLEIDYYKNE